MKGVIPWLRLIPRYRHEQTGLKRSGQRAGDCGNQLQPARLQTIPEDFRKKAAKSDVRNSVRKCLEKD